jgi:hypothetical protein
MTEAGMKRTEAEKHAHTWMSRFILTNEEIEAGLREALSHEFDWASKDIDGLARLAERSGVIWQVACDHIASLIERRQPIPKGLIPVATRTLRNPRTSKPNRKGREPCIEPLETIPSRYDSGVEFFAADASDKCHEHFNDSTANSSTLKAGVNQHSPEVEVRFVRIADLHSDKTDKRDPKDGATNETRSIRGGLFSSGAMQLPP